jgi:hypothetical protein
VNNLGGLLRVPLHAGIKALTVSGRVVLGGLVRAPLWAEMRAFTIMPPAGAIYRKHAMFVYWPRLNGKKVGGEYTEALCPR